MDGDPVGVSASRSVGCSKWTVLIGRTGVDTILSVPYPTLSLKVIEVGTSNLGSSDCSERPSCSARMRQAGPPLTWRLLVGWPVVGAVHLASWVPWLLALWFLVGRCRLNR